MNISDIINWLSKLEQNYRKLDKSVQLLIEKEEENASRMDLNEIYILRLAKRLNNKQDIDTFFN